jgi:hypothetical protein
MTRRFGRFLRQNTIALIALFIALGGTTFAAANALPKNSVGTKQLKKNAVTSVKIKNNQVTGADVRESSLGKVPSAANADHATAADSATNATNATNATHATTADAVAKTFHTGTIKASVGQTVPVYSFGPFTVTMRCTDLGSNNYRMELIVATTEEHSAAAGTSNGNGDFGSATPATVSNLTSTTAVYFSPYSIDLVAAAPSGAQIDAIAAGGIHTLGAACAVALDGWTS